MQITKKNTKIVKFDRSRNTFRRLVGLNAHKKTIAREAINDAWISKFRWSKISHDGKNICCSLVGIVFKVIDAVYGIL